MQLNREKLNFILLLFVVVAAISLDMSFGFNSFKFGNLIVLMVVAIVASVTLVFRSMDGVVIKLGISDYAYFAFLFLVIASLMWSPSKSNTVFQAVMIFSIWLLAQLVSNVSPVVTVKALIYVSVTACLISLVMYVVAPSLALQPSPSGSMPELRGIFHHQLRLGLFSGVVLGLILISYINGEWRLIFKNKFYLIMCATIVSLTLVLSFARLYGVFSFFSMLLIIFFPKSPIYRYLWIMLFFIIVALLISNGDSILYFFDSIGVDVTLTGRTTIWEKTIELANEKMFLGWGYPSFDSSSLDVLWGLYRPAHPHNSFIQAYFELGILGLFSVITLVLLNFYEILSPRNNDFISRMPYSLFLILLMLLGSLVGANYASKPSFLLVIFMVFFIQERKSISRVKI